jgi:hypothetical protein
MAGGQGERNCLDELERLRAAAEYALGQLPCACLVMTDADHDPDCGHRRLAEALGRPFPAPAADIGGSRGRE